MLSVNIIPDEALNSHIGVLGKTGGGKTFTGKGLVERLLRLQRHVVVVDPTGAWWGLRTGFEIPIFGGRHGDIDVADTAEAGDAVAAVAIEQRTSAIVDLSLMSGAGQRRFMRGFAHRLRQKPPGALWLVLDEADEFLPQMLPNDMTTLFGDLKWMVRRGRLNGFRVMMITQRPAEIAKAVLTQIETLVAHRLTAPQDRKAVEEWVKGHHDPDEAREVLSTLASLEKGEAWVWSPDIGLLKRAKMPPIETFDSGRTPEPGEADLAPPELARLDLSAIRSAVAEVVEPEEARIRNKSVPDEAALRAADEKGYRRGKIAGYAEGVRDGAAPFKAVIAAIEPLKLALAEAEQSAVKVEQWRGRAVEAIIEGTHRIPPKAPQAAPKPLDGNVPEPLNQTALAVASLLKAIAPDEVSWEDALLLIGRRPGSGDAGKARKALRDHGLVEFGGSGVRASDALRGDGSIAPSHKPDRGELVTLWAQKLRGPGGDILTDLYDNGPATREEVGRRIGKAHTSGWFGKGMKDLTRSGLVETRGGVLHLNRLLEREAVAA